MNHSLPTQLRLLRREQVSRVVLCVGHLWGQIESFVGDGSRFGLAVDYSLDGPELLGTGGALSAALPKLGHEFLVMYGDSWLDTAYAPIVDAFRRSGKPALMTVFRNEGKWDTSNVWFEEGRIRRYDKRERVPEMRYIDWGLGVLRAEIIAARATGHTIRPSQASIPSLRRGANSPVTRSARASTRSDRQRVCWRLICCSEAGCLLHRRNLCRKRLRRDTFSSKRNVIACVFCVRVEHRNRLERIGIRECLPRSS